MLCSQFHFLISLSQCVVIVATVRALKMHGGGPDVVAGKPLDSVYKEEALGLVRAGCSNLIHHINNIKKFGMRAVVAINRYSTLVRFAPNAKFLFKIACIGN